MGRRYLLVLLVGVLVVGVAMPAMGGPNPIGKTSASAKKLAKKANKRAKKADRRARKANKRARKAQSAADAAQGTANAAQSTANAAEGKADANTARLACPAATTPIAGGCVENANRTAAGGSAAEVDCNNAKGSLPSQQTLILFRNVTGADLGDPAEWTSDIGIDGGTGGLGEYRLIVGDGGVHSYQTNVGVDYQYRCVFNMGS